MGVVLPNRGVHCHNKGVQLGSLLNGIVRTLHVLASQSSSISFKCIDQDQESLPGSSSNADGALFYHGEATCVRLLCPPYDPQKELDCVVHTK